jgi:cytidylate kinase
MTEKVTITVAGRAGSGKSALADILFDTLSDMGLVTGQVGTIFQDLRRAMTDEQKAAQLDYLRNNVVVIIDEKQTPRDSL